MPDHESRIDLALLAKIRELNLPRWAAPLLGVLLPGMLLLPGLLAQKPLSDSAAAPAGTDVHVLEISMSGESFEADLASLSPIPTNDGGLNGPVRQLQRLSEPCLMLGLTGPTTLSAAA